METYTIKQLWAMAKDKGIKHGSRKGKTELCELLELPLNEALPKHKHLTSIRVNPKPICLTNEETKTEHNFKSIYAACKYFKVNPGSFGAKNKYKKRCTNMVIDGSKFIITYP